jgi:hypothetical protein
MWGKALQPFKATNIISGEVRLYNSTLEASKDWFNRTAIAQVLKWICTHHLGWRFEYQTSEATPEPVQTIIPWVAVTFENLINNTFQVNNWDDEWMLRGTFEECYNFIAGCLANKYMNQSRVRKYYMVRIP